MGCFSFMCKVCGKPILSNSFTGQEVNLYLLKDGKIIEHMSGEYDSYGRVFNENHDGSIEWTMDWKDVCSLMFHKNINNGIAAIHTKCSTRSYDDPNQGWGENLELIEDYDPDKKL